ncbi:O-antigen ligase family protein, partial [Patescibacteria group bacterium]
MNKSEFNLDKVFGVLLALLVFLMPVFFLPITTEFFEFNKLMLLTGFSIILTVLWIVKIVQKKGLGVVKSVIDLPLFLFTAVTVLSAIFSLNKDTSIFGSQGRWFPSMFSILVMYVFYYILTANLKGRGAIKAVVYSLLAGATASSLVTLFSYFGMYVGSASYLKTPSFNTTGSGATASILAALGAIIAFSSLIYETRISSKLALVVSIVVNFFLALLIPSSASWAVLVIGGLGILLFSSFDLIKKNGVILNMVAGIMLALTLMVLSPTTRDFIVNENHPQELKLSPKQSWIIASSTIRDFPLLATGPSSFYLNFPRYRAISMNTGDFWNLNFDKPYNEVFNSVATLGIVGTIAGVFLAMKMLKTL